MSSDYYGDSRIRPAIWNAIHPEPNTGCWLWSGEATKLGYGRARPDPKKPSRRVAHAMVYEALFGPIAAGLEFDHRCEVTLCVNPEHVEPVTHEENMRRRRKPVCKRGHTKDPTYLHDCRECCKLRAAAQRERQRAEKMDPKQWDEWLTENFVSSQVLTRA